MTSLVPSDSLRNFLGEASGTYYQSLKDVPAAIDYLRNRGMSGDSARLFRLGVVDDPLPGHEKYKGMLSIPYLTRAGVVSIRFRCIPEIEHPGQTCKEIPKHPKYRSLPSDPPRVYNVESLHKPSQVIAITEGEMDCVTATQAGIPTVGLPGVSSFRDYMTRLFAGYQTVWILADNDDKGQGEEFAEKIAGKIQNARISLMPPGHDVNSFVVENGAAALLDRLEFKK